MKRKLLVIAIVLGFLVYYIVQQYRPLPSSAQLNEQMIVNCPSADAFLCKSLGLLTEKDFIQKITGITVNSYDGSTHLSQHWTQDSNGNFAFISQADGVERDRMIHKNNRHFTKNSNDTQWQEQLITGDAKGQDESRLADQLSLDETMGSLFADSPTRNNFVFTDMGNIDCGNTPCRKYMAIDKNNQSTSQKRWYLYFDTATNSLIKFEDFDPAYQLALTFEFSPQVIPDVPTQ